MTSRLISISLRSKDRDLDTYPEASDFMIDLGVKLERVREIRLGSIEFAARPSQYTIESGRNDTVYYDEGWRVDTGECSCKVMIDSTEFDPTQYETTYGQPAPAWWTAGDPSNVMPVWNHQLVIAQQAHDGTYPPHLNIVLTVPAWLMEISNKVPDGSAAPEQDVTGYAFETVPCTTTSSSHVPHGLLDYQAWHQENTDRPQIVSVAMSTFEDILFSDPADVTPLTSTTVADGNEYQFELTATVAGTGDCTAPTKLNALVKDQCRFNSVVCGFIHAPEWHAQELCSFLNTALSRRTNALNTYKFQMFQGKIEIVLVGEEYVWTHHPVTEEKLETPVASCPKLFYSNCPNKELVPAHGQGLPCDSSAPPYSNPDVSPTGSGGACTSLGYFMGFSQGMRLVPRQRVTKPGPAGVTKEKVTGFFGKSPPTLELKLKPGFYDPKSLRDHVDRRHNWGYFPNNGGGDSAQFGFIDSTGCSHTIVVRAGKYFPFELCNALEYQLNRLDTQGIWRTNTSNLEYGIPAVGDVKYTVTHDRATQQFVVACHRFDAAPVPSGPLVYDFTTDAVTSVPVPFGLVFYAPDVLSASGANIGPSLVAEYLGFDTISYTGKTQYTGRPVQIPAYTNTLSQGPPNAATVRPLGQHDCGHLEGYGSGPWASRFPGLVFHMGMNSNQYYSPSVKSLPSVGDLCDARPSDQSATFDLTTNGGQVVQALVNSPGQNYRVGDKIIISSCALAVTQTSNQGGVVSVVVVARGQGFGVNPTGVGGRTVPQGVTRVVHGNNTPCAHRLMIQNFALRESVPFSGQEATAWPNPEGRKRGSRSFRSTTRPFGFQVGDVVRYQESEVLRLNNSVGSGGNLTVAVTSVRAPVPGALPGGPVGEVLGVNIVAPGDGYVAGSVVVVNNGTDDSTNCLLTVTRVDAAGQVLEVEVLSGGSNYASPTPPFTTHTVMGYYPQNAVVVESINSGLNVHVDDDGAIPPPPSSVHTARCPVHLSSSPRALGAPTRNVDGSAVRVRISENVFYDRDPTGVRRNRTGNLDMIAPADCPRIEFFVRGATPFTFSKPDHAYELLGYGRKDLYGLPMYTAPNMWCVGGVPYVLFKLLSDSQARTQFNIHQYQNTQTSMLAKLIIGAPVTQTRALLFESGTGGYRNYSRVRIQILTPDLQFYRFHGKEFSFTLNFILDQDNVLMPSL